MKISKKLFALLLAVVLIFSMFAVAASAKGTATGEEAMTVTITTDKDGMTCETGEQIAVTVSIACNYNVPTFRFPILYDKSVLQTPTLLGQKAVGFCAANGTLSYNKFTDGTCVPDAYNADEWGVILVQWTANVSNGKVNCLNNPEGEAVATFNLKTKQDSTGKTGSIFIPSESDLLYYMAFEDPEVATSDYYMTPETCAMTFVPASVTVEGLSDVSLVPNTAAGSTAVVDEENLIVYGVTSSIASLVDVKNFVTATGGATISANPTELGYGTGATIDLTVGGETVKTYTVIYYGDTNGDGDVTSDDLFDVSGMVLGSVAIENENVLKAVDIGIPQDLDINVDDLFRESGVLLGNTVLDQTDPYAE